MAELTSALGKRGSQQQKQSAGNKHLKTVDPSSPSIFDSPDPFRSGWPRQEPSPSCSSDSSTNISAPQISSSNLMDLDISSLPSAQSLLFSPSTSGPASSSSSTSEPAASSSSTSGPAASSSSSTPSVSEPAAPTTADGRLSLSGCTAAGGSSAFLAEFIAATGGPATADIAGAAAVDDPAAGAANTAGQDDADAEVDPELSEFRVEAGSFSFLVTLADPNADICLVADAFFEFSSFKNDETFLLPDRGQAVVSFGSREEFHAACAAVPASLGTLYIPLGWSVGVEGAVLYYKITANASVVTGFTVDVVRAYMDAAFGAGAVAVMTVHVDATAGKLFIYFPDRISWQRATVSSLIRPPPCLPVGRLPLRLDLSSVVTNDAAVRRVFLHGPPFWLAAEKLKAFLQTRGFSILSVGMALLRQTGRRAGYGFVLLEGDSDRALALIACVKTIKKSSLAGSLARGRAGLSSERFQRSHLVPAAQQQ